mgnify:CR=1 FL=1
MNKRLIASTLLFLAACTSAAQAATYEMFRDPNCGCCGKWADHVRAENEVPVEVTVSQDMSRVKQQHGVPQDLWEWKWATPRKPMKSSPSAPTAAAMSLRATTDT